MSIGYSSEYVDDTFHIESYALNDIAIIGISAKIAEAENVQEYWDVLRTGKDCIRTLPDYRKRDIVSYYNKLGLKVDDADYSIGGFLQHIDRFDYEFFGLSPKEASLIDPCQRLLLQAAYEAIADAGYEGSRIKGSRTGIYVGHSSDFGTEYKSFIEEFDPQSIGTALPGNIKSIIASRISYFLDLKGPSILIDTACSSSLVAIHLACQAILNGECDMALAGSVKVNLLPIRNPVLRRIGMESQNGKVSTFDDQANGTVFGEGVAAVLLKPLHLAIEDKDNIYAVIKGSAVNQDGSTVGITAPNSAAQEDVILQAWRNANLNPSTLTAIEAHGTGTKLGDPIEVQAISSAFERFTNHKQFCSIASVKTNIGHLDHLAGLAGLVKMILSLKEKKLPATLHFTKPNRHIAFESSPLYVNTELSDWESQESMRICGVSSFGLSGTNCHVVLEEAPSINRTIQEELESPPLPLLFTVSARTEEALHQLIDKYKTYLLSSPEESLSNVCFTANTGREHFRIRAAWVVNSREDLISELSAHSKHPNFHLNDEGRNVSELKAQTDAVLAQILSKEADPGAFDHLCKLYMSGAEIDWIRLYDHANYSKVSIPTYPFQSIRCWVGKHHSADHPLIGTYLGESAVTKDLHEILWVETMAPKGMKFNTGFTLVLHNHHLISEKIMKSLRIHNAKLIEVAREDWQEPDYRQVIQNHDIQSITRIVYLLGIHEDREEATIEEFARKSEQVVNGLFYLTRELLKARINHRIDIVLISNYATAVTGLEKDIHPLGASMFGLGKVIGQEYKNLVSRSIDIDNETPIEMILSEIDSSPSHFRVAYRDHRRYVPHLSRYSKSIAPQNSKIKAEGCYVITGGTGGIGLELAKYLVSKNNGVKIALLSRTKFPERQQWQSYIQGSKRNKISNAIEIVLELEKQGATVLFIQADISDENQVSVALRRLRNAYMRINGFIHCAGIAGDGFLLRKDNKRFESVLAPKVIGTRILDRMTREDRPDFFILCSSITALTGGQGQGDYTAANCYLDAFSMWRNMRGFPTLSINWPAWKEVGMAKDYGVNDDRGVLKDINTKNAINRFDDVLRGEKCSSIIIGEPRSDAFYDLVSPLDTPDTPDQLSDDLLELLANGQISVDNAIQRDRTRP